MNKFNIAIVFSAVVLIYACTPYEEDGIDLPDGPSATFSWSYLENDSNRVVLTGLSSEDSFLHLWEFGNGLTSVLESDTAFYPQAGEYEVTYTVHNAGGMSQSSQMVSISQTLELPCDGELELLTGCDNQKTWVFSSEIAAIAVGPDPYSTSWDSSPQGGLVDEQYDDSYQFSFDGEFIYNNNGGTVNPYEGYVVNELEVPELTFLYSEGTGTSGENQIIIPTVDEFCWFIGTWDSGPAYDIVELTETRLVLHSTQRNGDCTQGDGFFTYIFVAQ